MEVNLNGRSLLLAERGYPRGLLKVDGFCVPVLVLAVRSVYGREQYQVTPVGGSGTRWVSYLRVELDTSIDHYLLAEVRA